MKTEKLLNEDVLVNQQRMEKYQDRLFKVSHNFGELNEFTGRFLRHIYDHKREVEGDWNNYQNQVAVEIRSAPPIFSALE